MGDRGGSDRGRHRRRRGLRAVGVANDDGTRVRSPAGRTSRPVARYLAFALTPGQAVVRSARFAQRGDFAMRPDSRSPFTAIECFSTNPPGFLWDARIRASMVPVFVRDGYLEGEGALSARLFAIIPVANRKETPDMASAELLRYLAEAVLFPTALLERDGISWEPIDDSSSRVRLTDRATAVACDMHFGEHGEVVRVSALRYRDVDGAPEVTPWIGHWGDYRRIAGMMIPTSGWVEWVLPDGPFVYWRGRISDARYEFAR